MGHVRLVNEDIDPVAHLRQALQSSHPALCDARPDPSWEFALHFFKHLASDIVRWRHELLIEIELLCEAFEEETDAWWQALPEHVAKAGSQLEVTHALHESLSPPMHFDQHLDAVQPARSPKHDEQASE